MNAIEQQIRNLQREMTDPDRARPYVPEYLEGLQKLTEEDCAAISATYKKEIESGYYDPRLSEIVGDYIIPPRTETAPTQAFGQLTDKEEPHA